ncbi:MAG TPA: hypothetical protein VFC78_02585 [Tepidisphaeraceae bacterium]|nr:hypothetical protein [Tepidisphaeraceae bacterium]
MTEITFIVEEQEGGGYRANAVGATISTQAATREELIANLSKAVRSHFEPPENAPMIAHLHYVHDETVVLPSGAQKSSEKKPLTPEEIRRKLAGSVLRYDDPFAPAVPLEDWLGGECPNDGQALDATPCNSSPAMAEIGDTTESERYPLRGREPYRFEDPFSPVGLEDWELLK